MWGLFKPKTVVITNKNNIVDTLNLIAEILEDNKHYAQAEAVRKPADSLSKDDTINFLKYLKTVDIWGGSGAAWEVGEFKSQSQERDFQRHFVHFSELLQETGIRFRPANQIANIFKRELRNSDGNGS